MCSLDFELVFSVEFSSSYCQTTFVHYTQLGRELSLGRPTTSSSVYTSSDKAVDGHFLDVNQTSEVDVNSTCFQTAGSETNPWWTIDLGAVYNILDIYFYGKLTDVGKYKCGIKHILYIFIYIYIFHQYFKLSKS